MLLPPPPHLPLELSRSILDVEYDFSSLVALSPLSGPEPSLQAEPPYRGTSQLEKLAKFRKLWKHYNFVYPERKIPQVVPLVSLQNFYPQLPLRIFNVTKWTSKLAILVRKCISNLFFHPIHCASRPTHDAYHLSYVFRNCTELSENR